MAKSFKQRSVDVHDFAMIPRADIPRSTFRMQKALKTSFSASYLVPIFCEEMLPGDTFNVNATIFARMATPIVPQLDNLHLETFFFFVPNRLVWANWVKMMGEQDNPGDSISYTIPQITSPANGWAVSSVFDYFGLPTVGQVAGGATVTHSVLPLRGYNLIWNLWFRDENLQNRWAQNTNDGPDVAGNYTLLKRGKRHDYITAALPFVQKGTAVSLPLGTTATVRTQATHLVTGSGLEPVYWRRADTGVAPIANTTTFNAVAGGTVMQATNVAPGGLTANSAVYPANLYADLSTATSATINQLRQSFQIQRLLERDARGGTRYTEIVRAHFGVISPDARLQRPEYLGGGRSPVQVHPIEQNTATGLTGGTTPLGSLAAYGTILGHNHGFTQSFTEHGYVIGLANVRADITYQQGLRRHWSRSTRYDYYFPAFAMLGEQSILNKEVYIRGDANDNLTFGYQERWAEYRYNPSEITGLMRSTAAGTLNVWHYSENFAALPVLNGTFMEDKTNEVLVRNLAAGASANNAQFLVDIFYDIKAARPLPMYSVPGLVDHF